MWTQRNRKYANQKTTAESREKKCPAPQSQTNTYRFIPLPIPLLSDQTLPLTCSYMILAMLLECNHTQMNIELQYAGTILSHIGQPAQEKNLKTRITVRH